MQGATPVAFVREPLAGLAFLRLGPGPLATLSDAKRYETLFSKLLFVMLKSPINLGFHYTLFMLAWLGESGLIHGPWSE